MAPKKQVEKAEKIGNSLPSSESNLNESSATNNTPVQFTSSSTIDSMVYPDDTIEILACVDAIQAPRVVGAKGNFKLFKILLNNDAGKRIQCLACQDQIERVASEINMNKIIHINGAVSKEIAKPLYNTGNVPFELSIQNHTTIDRDRGYFGLNSGTKKASTIVEWSELGDMDGKIIEISGWLKMEFKMTNHKSGESTYEVGAITNGESKLAVRIASFDDIPSGLQIGCAIRVTGKMIFDKLPYLQVSNGSSIKIDDKRPMKRDSMHDITSMPKKTARNE